MEINNQQKDITKIVKIMLMAASVLEAAYLIFNQVYSISSSVSFQFSDVLQYSGLAMMIAITVLFIKSWDSKEKPVHVLMFILAAILYVEVATSISTSIKIMTYYGQYTGIGLDVFSNVDGLLEAFFVLSVVVAIMDKTPSLYKVAMIIGWITLACEAVFCVMSIYNVIAGTSATSSIWSTMSMICYGPAWLIFEGAWIIYCAKKIKVCTNQSFI